MSSSEQVGADPPEEGDASAGRRSRRARWIGVAALCGVALTLAVWSERRTIGTAVIDRKLAAAHVRARYRIVDLGLGRQRLTGVVIGDPARPDLVADWIELRTRIGLDGAAVTAVRAGGLRVRASVVGGRLSLGEIDRLLPAATGSGGFRLPAIDLQVSNARAHVTSPVGPVELTLTGSGRLDTGFRGRVAATSGRLAVAGCVAPNAALAAAVTSDRGAVTLTGPLRADRITCAGGAVERPLVEIDATLADGLTAWRGGAALRGDRVTVSSFAARDLRGRIGFAGSAKGTTGEIALAGSRARVADVASRGIAARGRYRFGADATFTGSVRATGAAVPARLLATLRRQQRAGHATPIAPLVAQGSAALVRAAQDVDVAARVDVGGGTVSLSRVEASSRSGARASFVADAPIRIAGGAITGTARLSGGGLPSATVRFAQAAPDAPIRGIASVAPYAAGGARLALDPVRFTWERRRGSLATVAVLSGPLSDGRIDGLRLPITAAWDGAGAVRIDPGCMTVSFDRLVVATLRLAAVRAPLCATGPALVQVRGGDVTGGARIATLRLEGTLGASPMTLAASDTRLTLEDRRIEAREVSARLGAGETATRLDLGRMTGRVTADGIGGRLEGAAGRIGTVPLLLSDGAGEWSFDGGALTVAADATVADASPAARFKPLRAEALRLRLEGGAIEATTRLVAPERGVRVADVAIAHDLARGAGDATVSIPALAFTEAFQPDALTPLTFGVIADVRGTVTGDARIGWSPAGVTGTGTFRTEGLDLAAAFGPVRGLAGSIRFTDLLRLESAPGQVATVASINPGVPVEDGRIVYRLAPDAKVEIASGHWPFAGGSLDLRPTTLAFGAPSERRLTFALDGVDAGRFLQQFNFGNLSATGIFDGTLPMVFDATGGRIEGGELRVRRGGGNIAYLGELTKEDLGTWGNLAFQALRSIDYRDLEIVMNGPLAGEMITEVRFAGISQGKGARSNFLIRRLQTLPFVFNIRIRAPFRGLIDSAQSFYDPTRLISRNLPALLQQQNDVSAAPPAIQPGASEPGP